MHAAFALFETAQGVRFLVASAIRFTGSASRHGPFLLLSFKGSYFPWSLGD